MKNNNYSFISQLSFEDPYSVIQDVVYGTEDNLSSVSSKLITGIYNDNNLTNISSKLITGISNENMIMIMTTKTTMTMTMTMEIITLLRMIILTILTKMMI